MKKIFSSEIKENDKVESSFLVTRKDEAVSKVGKAYLNLTLVDKDGEMEGRVWDNAESLTKLFHRGDVIKVAAQGVTFQGKLQLKVQKIRKLEDAEYSLSDYLRSAERPLEEMMAELDGVLAEIKDKHISALLNLLFADDEIRGKFMKTPAAKSMHHPYIGGMIEHVLSLCKLGEFTATHYKDVNKDLVMAGLILHDIGKIYELSFERGTEYTDEGKLLGHIMLGAELIDSKIRELSEFPPKLAMQLKHILLSHHTLLEYGSPKRPKTLEAFIVAFLDDMDAKVNTVQTLRGSSSDTSDWSPRQFLLDRAIYTGSNFTEGAEGVSDDTEEALSSPKEDPELF
jgi:3'-5' exoribonuclease